MNEIEKYDETRHGVPSRHDIRKDGFAHALMALVPAILIILGGIALGIFVEIAVGLILFAIAIAPLVIGIRRLVKWVRHRKFVANKSEWYVALGIIRNVRTIRGSGGRHMAAPNIVYRYSITYKFTDKVGKERTFIMETDFIQTRELDNIKHDMSGLVAFDDNNAILLQKET